MKRWQELLVDDTGFVVSVELVLVVTILVIGLIPGLLAVRTALNSELSDLAAAMQAMSQATEIASTDGPPANNRRRSFVDHSNFESAGRTSRADNCIAVFATAK